MNFYKPEAIIVHYKIVKLKWRKNMKLYICGNGFDCHNGFKTEYKYYKKFLQEYYSYDSMYSGIVNRAEKFLYTSFINPESWNDIESSLTFDYLNYFKDYCNCFNIPRIQPGVSFPEINRTTFQQFRSENFTEDLIHFTGECYYDWISKTYNFRRNEDKPYPKDIAFLMCNQKDLFINFNYTPTLQDIYKIPDKNVLHIHGALIDVDQNNLRIPHTLEDGRVITELRSMLVRTMQFGTIENDPERIKSELEKIEIVIQNDMFSREKLINDIYNVCRCTYKNIDINSQKLFTFLADKKISEIVVMGHTFDGIDMPYYTEVIFKLLKNCTWTFYCYTNINNNNYGNVAENRAMVFAKKLGLSLSENSFPRW